MIFLSALRLSGVHFFVRESLRFETELRTNIGTISVEADGKPAQFEFLRLFDRFSFAGRTTYFLGVATSRTKKAQSVTCAFRPAGHGSCFEAVGDNVESVGYATEGYMLHISASCEDSEDAV